MENSTFEHNGFKTGILFIVFNRPDFTKEVFEAIRSIKPERLYIASDGPRLNVEEDFSKVEKTREYLLSNIDWDCKVQTLFREENMGCGKNVKLAIDWFFENEEYGIILEDDCLPVPSFFQYCEELLKRYADDDRIGMISGANHLTNYYNLKDSYLFSKSFTSWGWATWKRSWQFMDHDMTWLESNKMAIIKNISYSRISHSHWKNAIYKVENKLADAWDYQWYFSLSGQNQLCIFPKHNLISNIGWGDDATHTIGKGKQSYKETENIEFPLKHPEFIMPDRKYDAIFERRTLSRQILLGLFPQSLKDRIKKIM
ncbi:nucleotide-diphospho-sugar transferase [Maribacter sp. 2308TA10-17]|uniref:nucleotide-diphospho-sugar transferase n=1 Tax=Maribacter sp. 2308TA10-17 TaxID=3386276 RepID=UPI0039BCDBC0